MSLTFVMFAGQEVKVGGVASTTLVVKLQVAVRPDPSVTCRVTVVVPKANSVPMAGVCVTALAGSEQLSAAMPKPV